MEKKFYDHGWNARVAGEPFDANATLDWRDGWTDCDGTTDRRFMFDGNRPHLRDDGIPTRSDVRWDTPAEVSIRRAIAMVEAAGASPALTEAVNFLSKAHDCVADHVEGIK